jgi:hypothetical protein
MSIVLAPMLEASDGEGERLSKSVHSRLPVWVSIWGIDSDLRMKYALRQS